MSNPVSLIDCATDKQEEINEAADKAIKILMDLSPNICALHLKRLGEVIVKKSDSFLLQDLDRATP